MFISDYVKKDNSDSLRQLGRDYLVSSNDAERPIQVATHGHPI